MTPRPGRDRWFDFDRPAAPRLAVGGGVTVPRTWKPSTPEAVRLVVTAEGRTTAGIASRGRTYARAGQVVEVRVGPGEHGPRASGAVQGSDAAPYAVSLTRLDDGDVEATCTCPYGCDDVEWCKHAAALAFVVGHLLEISPDVAAAWSDDASGNAPDGASDGSSHGTGEGAGRAGGRGGVPSPAIPAAELAALVTALRRPTVAGDSRGRWRAALEVLPLP